MKPKQKADWTAVKDEKGNIKMIPANRAAKRIENSWIKKQLKKGDLKI